MEKVVQLSNHFISAKIVSGLKKLARNKDDKEVVDFFVSNFITCTDPSKLWIGEMIKEGEDRYTAWKKRTQSLSYLFKQEVETIFDDDNFDSMFAMDGSRHPQILKEHLRGNVSIETMVILDGILGYKKSGIKISLTQCGKPSV